MKTPYRRKPDQAITAIRLNLECEGLSYRKWGHAQRAKPGDWLVENTGDVYTVDHESFIETYREVGPGRWVKTTPLWAEQTTQAGSVPTKEGQTAYEAGDWLVSNHPDGSDAYAISAAKFEQLYEPDDSGGPATKRE